MYSLATTLSKSRVFLKLLNTKQYNFLPSLKFHSTSRPKILVTKANISEETIDKLKSECDVEIYEDDESMTKEELMKRIPGKDGLFCFLTDPVDKEVVAAAGDQLKVIATASVGYDHVDLTECKKRNVLVSNTPGVSAGSVAEWTLMLMISAGRNFLEAATAIKKGEWVSEWNPTWLAGKGLQDAVVGIVGMGRIGQCVLKRLLPFEVEQVLYYDPMHPIKPAEEMGAVYTNLEELVENADFIVCLIPLSDETRNLFDKRLFDLMKPTAIFINTSRGDVVNQEDLYDVLKNKKIHAAAIDVTNPEPLPKDHELTTLPNLIITPHRASSETNVLMKMANLAAENILLGVQGKPLKTPVSMPE